MKEKIYEISEEVAELAKKVLKKDHGKITEDFSTLNIIYIKNYPNISKTIAGQCIKPGRLLKHFSEADVIIQVSGELWDGLNDDVRYILLLHEMKHVGIKYKKDGSKVIFLRNHDVQDFSDIIREYGIDWFDSIKSVSASVNGFKNGEEDNIRL